MGFYPVCPATDQYVIGAPLFKKLTLTLENGKRLIINAPANSDKNKYVQSMQWNNKGWDKNWLTHFELVKGGTLNFLMGNKPNKRRGASAEAYPYSLSTDKAGVYNR
jgi:putative alpha-1,2-mannosidase